MSYRAKIVLGLAISFCGFSIWGVHWLQKFEREIMYKGVIRDDERRRDKLRRREEEISESQRKREIYESVQSVSASRTSEG